MEFIDENTIKLDKILNKLDKFVINFVRILEKLNFKYVIISGYVAILFGRNRSSEDVDIFIEKLDEKQFELLWNELIKEFECINVGDFKDAYFEYLLQDNAVRFANGNEFIPNMEVKFPSKSLDFWVLDKRKKVLLNDNLLYVSPLELQISFKLVLGSEKDIEDARFLYKLFKDKLDINVLNSFNRKLKVVDKFDKYLR
jgi:hypothetical protein